MEMMLQWEGCEVLSFARPAHALEFLSENIVDLAVVDWNMPGMTGGEFLRRAGELVLPLFTPRFVVFSGDPNCQNQCEGLGVWDFLPKPFRPELLDRLLRPASVAGAPSSA